MSNARGMPGGGGGMLKLRFDRCIRSVLFNGSCDLFTNHFDTSRFDTGLFSVGVNDFTYLT